MDFFTQYAEKVMPYALEESIRAKAYDSLPAEDRAALKLHISRLYRFWERHDYAEKRIREFADFSAQEKMVPCAYAFVCCKIPSVRGAELIPALLPALMAGVVPVVPWFVGDTATSLGRAQVDAIPDDILVSLELLGVEEAFYSTPQELAELLQHIPLSKESRFVALGQGIDSDCRLFFRVLAQEVPMQYFAKGEAIYPSLTPQWYCNHSIHFLP